MTTDPPTGVSPKSFTLNAQPTESGFFGLSELREFTASVVEPYTRAETQTTLILDFSFVKVWDISAILWLVVALHHYRHNMGLSFLLRLPEGSKEMPPSECDAFDKSADYLRRWAFDVGLRNIACDVDSLLVPEQSGYFPPTGPKRFYLERKLAHEGILDSLISRRLVQIRNLSDPGLLGETRVSAARISDCIEHFQSARIGDILKAQCGIEKRTGDLFSDHLLTEALMNVQEHPNATIGMVAISVLGNTNELVLSVVDNGDSIPQTIYPRFRNDHRAKGKTDVENATTYSRDTLGHHRRAEIAHYATLAHVTRKTGAAGEGAGMGLTYIRDDTVRTFSGKFWVLTDGVLLKYSGNLDSPEEPEWPNSWHGNLLRIAIPLQPRNDSRGRARTSR